MGAPTSNAAAVLRALSCWAEQSCRAPTTPPVHAPAGLLCPEPSHAGHALCTACAVTGRPLGQRLSTCSHPQTRAPARPSLNPRLHAPSQTPVRQLPRLTGPQCRLPPKPGPPSALQLSARHHYTPARLPRPEGTEPAVTPATASPPQHPTQPESFSFTPTNR